jgi:hypothetical protein
MKRNPLGKNLLGHQEELIYKKNKKEKEKSYKERKKRISHYVPEYGPGNSAVAFD